MRRKIVAGNWKMNTVVEEARELAAGVAAAWSDEESNVELILFPPLPFISEVKSAISSVKVEVGAQNISSEISGAYTGEVSAKMVDSVGGRYVLVGHSERRQYFNESSELLLNKILRSFEVLLTPIFCCGESLEERNSGDHFNRIEEQISSALFGLSEAQMRKVIIAYEPVWAIGTGETATSEQAQEIHAFIRTLLSKKYNNELAEHIPILYGGSCKPGNATELFGMKDIDGGLIGGASLKSVDFIAIANSFS